MPSFVDVVRAWQADDGTRIHPAREHESEAAYWASGVEQAEEINRWLDPHSLVMDFACGDGRLTIPLLDLGHKLIAVDANAVFLDRLQTKAGPDAGLEILLSDGLDLVVPNPLDAVIARAVFIHHSHADVARLVGKLAGLLKSGGLLICDWPLGPHHERVDWIDVTTWTEAHRLEVATAAGLEFVEGVKPTIWRKQ